MFQFFRKRVAPHPPITSTSNQAIEPYLLRLYIESRQILLRILLGEALPPRTSFPVDPVQTAEIVQRIFALMIVDEHLDGCRGTILKYFPGQLAVLFNLAGENDKLFPSDLLRESIRKHVARHQADLSGQPLDDADRTAIENLKRSSRLQQQLAYLVDYTPSKWLLGQEIPVVQESRRRRIHFEDDQMASDPAAPDGFLGTRAQPSDRLSSGVDPYLWSRDNGRLSGLCFSGGGIRSATFNLGILQGLAKKNLLRRFDYCSSVSGGGYIHQWLAAWIKREEVQQKGVSGSPGLDAVCQQLIPLPDLGCGPQAPEAIRWLRRYSNYLTPETGLLSADFWVTAAIWIRNTFLNQIILTSFLFSILLVPHIFFMTKISSSLGKIGDSPSASVGSPFIIKASLILVFVAASYLILVHSLATGLHDARRGKGCHSRLNDMNICIQVVLPSLVVSIAVSEFGFYFLVPGLSEFRQAATLCLSSFLGLLILNLALTWAGGALDNRSTVERDSRAVRILGFSLAALLAALVGTGAILLARNTFVGGSPLHFHPIAITAPSSSAGNPVGNAQAKPHDGQQATDRTQASRRALGNTSKSNLEASIEWRGVVTFGPPIVTLVPFLSIIVMSGLIGYEFEDWVLEWLARVRAWVTIYSLSWTLLVGVSLFGHGIVEFLIEPGHGNWIKWPAIGSWILTTVGSILVGKSGASSGEPKSTNNSPVMKVLETVGPPVYILGLLLLLAWVAQEALFRATLAGDSLSLLNPHYAYIPLFMVAFVPLAMFILFGWRVGINQFSMHSYYRNRLARCYLGASNTTRDPDPLTGFDTADVDDLRLSYFVPNRGYTGPFPIFCASLNISIGEDLAWQERKAASFVFTPVLSGYHIPWTGRHYRGQLSYNGFVPTERFAYPNGGIHISTVSAISGAAISPDWGYHSSPPMAFLLTMFNVRLGWWLENPRRSYLAFDPSGQPLLDRNPFPKPGFAPKQLLRELLGQIGDDREFVYLTDGGHFDNMGLYELVRRRCYEIVICDAEQDTGPVFEGIGMAIRKCRIDFGVEIALDLGKLACDAASSVSKVHWITGTIRYPETDAAQTGTILYIKSSITGNEAADVYNYRLQHKPFPHDSTLDQWFTESQFESYRRLGQQVIDECPYLA
jgi:hypothetical protein